MQHGPVQIYVDDTQAAAPPGQPAQHQRDVIRAVFTEMGIPLQDAKEQFGQVVVIHGLLCNFVDQTVSVPPAKRQNLKALWALVQRDRRRVPLKLVQSLAGVLNWLRCAAPQLQPVFVEVLALLRDCGTSKHVELPAEASDEVQRVLAADSAWDARGFFPTKPRFARGQLTCDAAGGSAQAVNLWGYVSYVRAPAAHLEGHINVEEFLAMFQLCVYAMAACIDEPRPLNIHLGGDNTTSLAWVSSGVSDVPLVRQLLRILYRFKAAAGIELSFYYVPSAQNQLADAGSRIDNMSYFQAYSNFHRQHGLYVYSDNPFFHDRPGRPSFVDLSVRPARCLLRHLGSGLRKFYETSSRFSAEEARQFLRATRREYMAVHLINCN